MTRYLVRAMQERTPYLADLQAAIPQLEIVWDEKRDAMDTWLRALAEAGADPVVHLEDDAFPTRDFLAKAEREIAQRPDDVIQFFSRRKADPTEGSRWMPGAGFSCAVCFYLPAGCAPALREYFPIWDQTCTRGPHPTAVDWHIPDWLARQRKRYWLVVPSLVQHRIGPSLIDHRRSSRRLSATFEP